MCEKAKKRSTSSRFEERATSQSRRASFSEVSDTCLLSAWRRFSAFALRRHPAWGRNKVADFLLDIGKHSIFSVIPSFVIWSPHDLLTLFCLQYLLSFGRGWRKILSSLFQSCVKPAKVTRNLFLSVVRPETGRKNLIIILASFTL